MKNDKYIDRVLSHIQSGKRKNEIEHELFDHIDEHEKFFSEIGYDEGSATEYADAKMGDADIVGERLNTVKKHFAVNYCILCAIQITAVIICAVYAILQDKVNDAYSLPQVQHHFSYIDFTINTSVLLLSLICLCLGIKSKRLLNSFTGAVGSVILINTKPYILQCELRNLFSDCDFYKYFYYSDYFDLYSKADGNLIISIILSVIVSAVSVTSIIVLIKTKLLKNTKHDIKLNRFSLIAVSVITVATVLLTGYTVYQAISVKDSLITKAEQEVQRLNDIVINNAEDFMSVDADELSSALDRHFESGDDGNYLLYGENEKYISDNSIRYKTAYAEVNVDSESTTITVNYSLLNPLDINGNNMPLDVEPIVYKYFAESGEYHIFSYKSAEPLMHLP